MEQLQHTLHKIKSEVLNNKEPLFTKLPLQSKTAFWGFSSYLPTSMKPLHPPIPSNQCPLELGWLLFPDKTRKTWLSMTQHKKYSLCELRWYAPKITLSREKDAKP